MPIYSTIIIDMNQLTFTNVLIATAVLVVYAYGITQFTKCLLNKKEMKNVSNG